MSLWIVVICSVWILGKNERKEWKWFTLWTCLSSLLCELYGLFTLWTCLSSLLCELYGLFTLWTIWRGKEERENNVNFMNYKKRTPGDNKLLNNNYYP